VLLVSDTGSPQRMAAGSSHYLKVVVSRSTVVPLGMHAAVLENVGRIRTGRNRFCPAFQTAACRHVRTFGRASLELQKDNPSFVCLFVQKRASSNISSLCAIRHLLGPTLWEPLTLLGTEIGVKAKAGEQTLGRRPLGAPCTFRAPRPRRPWLGRLLGNDLSADREAPTWRGWS
jgi:hypothetical protein